MNRVKVAQEILKLAREFVGVEFPSQFAMDWYLKLHPGADKSLHWVKQPSTHFVLEKPVKNTLTHGVFWQKPAKRLPTHGVLKEKKVAQEILKLAKELVAGVVEPLYGHTDENSAYVVDDYPYGFRLRTKIRYWMESSSKGWRFVSQTLNPKTQGWNAPKKSTYVDLAGAMFLDEKGHVEWEGLTSYGDADEALEFVKQFPQVDLSKIKKFSEAKMAFLSQLLSGERVFTLNGVRQPLTEQDTQRYQKDVEAWKTVAQHAH